MNDIIITFGNYQPDINNLKQGDVFTWATEPCMKITPTENGYNTVMLRSGTLIGLNATHRLLINVDSVTIISGKKS